MKDTPDYLGHRKRIKERYFKIGLDGLKDYEILELILTLAIPRRDTKPLAKSLIRKSGSLQAVLETSKEELLKVSGIGENAVLLLHLFKDVTQVYTKQRLEKKDIVSSPEILYEYLKVSLKASKDEFFYSIFLNNNNEIIESEVLQKGTVNKAVVYPRKIVERALFHHAALVIIAHNHPAGTLSPSENDVTVTDKIKKALATVDISLLDHIIIGNDDYISFKEKGLL